MKLLVHDVDDVLGCVWLGTACLTYSRARHLVPGEATRQEAELAFSQTEILETARRLCSKTVQNARVSQWANADHPDHLRNYLRAVGKHRRLARPDECDGVRVLPWELVPFETPVLAFEGEERTIRYGELVGWVLDTFPQLVPLRPVPADAPVDSSQSERRSRAPVPHLEPMETLADAGAETMTLRVGTRELEFRKVPLVFEDHGHRDVFQWDTGRTVADALAVPKLQRLRAHIERHHPDSLGRPLGRFLVDLKKKGDPFYREFLNSHGDAEFSTFSIRDATVLPARGLYLYAVDGTVRYIGRCRDWYGRRVNNGYGRIHPRACYHDGQVTNCRINSLVAAHRQQVAFYVHPLADEADITTLERSLIAAYAPAWNRRS